MARLTEALKNQYDEMALTAVEVTGLPDITTIYCRPLTVNQAREIDGIKDDWQRIAKHFQVRARDESGQPMIKPGELDDFMRYADAEVVGKAVIAMQSTDDAPGELEKNF